MQLLQMIGALPMNNLRGKADLIWNLANLPRGDYKPHEYADVILPPVVLRCGDYGAWSKRSARPSAGRDR